MTNVTINYDELLTLTKKACTANNPLMDVNSIPAVLSDVDRKKCAHIIFSQMNLRNFVEHLSHPLMTKGVIESAFGKFLHYPKNSYVTSNDIRDSNDALLKFIPYLSESDNLRAFREYNGIPNETMTYEALLKTMDIAPHRLIHHVDFFKTLDEKQQQIVAGTFKKTMSKYRPNDDSIGELFHMIQADLALFEGAWSKELLEKMKPSMVFKFINTFSEHMRPDLWAVAVTKNKRVIARVPDNLLKPWMFKDAVRFDAMSLESIVKHIKRMPEKHQAEAVFQVLSFIVVRTPKGHDDIHFGSLLNNRKSLPAEYVDKPLAILEKIVDGTFYNKPHDVYINGSRDRVKKTDYEMRYGNPSDLEDPAETISPKMR